MTFDQAAQEAAHLLGCSVDEAQKNSERLPSDKGFRFWDPTRGGGVILIDTDGEYLYVESGVRPDVALQGFLEGKRTLGANRNQ